MGGVITSHQVVTICHYLKSEGVGTPGGGDDAKPGG